MPQPRDIELEAAMRSVAVRPAAGSLKGPKRLSTFDLVAHLDRKVKPPSALRKTNSNTSSDQPVSPDMDASMAAAVGGRRTVRFSTSQHGADAADANGDDNELPHARASKRSSLIPRKAGSASGRATSRGFVVGSGAAGGGPVQVRDDAVCFHRCEMFDVFY
jgi:hypothetical protein